MLKLLIFDLDGTLLDTIQDITNSVNYAVEPFGIKPFPVETIKSMVGSGISRLIESLLSQHTKDSNALFISKEKAVSRFIKHYSEHLLDNTMPYPEVKETLSKLDNFKKAVISNKRESLSKNALEGSGLLKFFDAVLGSDSIPERKPSPVPVFELLRRFNVSNNEAVVIGDSNFDIEAGRAAGVKTIAVTYGYRSREILKDADFMIDDFGALLTLLPKIAKKTD